MDNVGIFMAIWNILRPLGTFMYFMVILCILWSFGIWFSRYGMLYCTKKNLATLQSSVFFRHE
jgi:hypothetical protein